MSGIEVAGLVLGLFPLFLGALESYRTGLGVIQFSGQNNRDIDVLRTRVKVEHARLSRLLEMLFEPMGVEIGNAVDWDITEMTASNLDTMLEERLSDSYPVFVELMSYVRPYLLNPSYELLDSTNALRTKLRLISSRKDIEGLVQNLSDYIHSLYTVVLLTTNLKNAPTVETMRIRKLLSNAKTAQRDVNTLYQASYPVEGTVLVRELFLGGFRIPNITQYRRQLRFLSALPNPSAFPTKPRQDHWLKVLVEFDKEPEEPFGPLSLQTSTELDLSVIRPERLMHSISDKDRKSVRFQTPVISHSEVRQQSQPAKSISLSELSRIFHVPKPPSEYNPTMLIDEPDMLSLRDILRSSIRTSHVSRIRLAALLTWNVICLINTPWMKQGLKAVDICFIRDHDVTHVDDLFIRHSCDQEHTEHSDFRSLIEGHIFQLGVILLELSLHRNIDDLQESQGLDYVPDEIGGRVLISRMIDAVYLESGTKYGDLVRRCVSFQSDSTLDLPHLMILEKTQVFLIREILSPLEDLFKIFGSLDSKATIHLAGLRAISPKTEHLIDDSTIDDRAQGLHEPSTRPPIEDSCLEYLSTLRQYAFKLYQKCDAHTLAFTRVMLAAKETLLSIEEADDLTHRVLLDGSEEKVLLDLSTDCLADFARLETLVQGAKDGEALDDLINRFTLNSGSLALFNKTVKSSHSNTIDPEINSVISASETDVSSVFDEKLSGSSSATSFLEPVWAESRQVADEFLFLIRDEALLGPLLMSIFEELEELDSIHLRSCLLCLLDKYSEELLLQAQQEPGTESKRQAAMMIYVQASYIVDKMYAEYSFCNLSVSKMLEQVMLRIPGELQEQRSHRVSKVVANVAKRATRREFPEEGPSTTITPNRNYSDIPVSMIQTGFERRSAASLGFSTIDLNAKIVFIVVKDFLVSGIAFGHLRLALREILHQKPMDIVRQEVFSGIPASDENSYDVNFLVYWDIRQYLNKELTPQQTLAPILTVSGGSRDVFATSCVSYMQWLWRGTSIDLLDALDQTMKHGKYVSADGSLQISEAESKQSNLDCKLSVSVVGTRYKVSKVAQQLVWLSNVLRTTHTNRLSLSRMEFMWIDQGRFELRPGTLAAVSADDDSCWHPLLGRTVIADGFPIPARDGEVGLELPSQSLIHLSKVYAEMEFDNRVVLYGSSSLLYPTSLSVKPHTETNSTCCVQWHLIAGEHPHISASLLAEDPNWAKIDDKTFLPIARSIVGYCKTARILVGTEEYKYEETKGSELLDDESMPGVKINSINWGTAGMSIFGVQVGMDVVYSRSMEVSPEITKYDDILVTARTMSMILYDAGEQRGWLLPVQHVLLHMAQCWIKRHTPGVNLTYAKSEWEGGNAIEKILTDNYKLFVKTLLDDDSEWLLRDLIKQIWRDLQGCRIARKQRKAENKADQTLPSAKLLAWEFLEFIEGTPEFRMRKCPMEFSGCGWDALAEDDDMMILACRGLGDVILPADTVQLCNEWSTVPANRAYLTASISCMRILPQSVVGGLCMSLTKRVFWRPTAQSLLDDCAHRRHTNCGKSLQKVITKVDGAPIASTAFPPSGAVVFGVNRLHRSLKQSGEAQHRRTQNDESDEADITGKKSKWRIFKRSNR